MLGIKTNDGTFVWMDSRGKIEASGAQARHWRKVARGKHWLLDLDSKIKAERAAERRGEYIIVDPCDVQRRVRSFGELVDVMRRLEPGCQEYIQIPPSHLREKIHGGCNR